MYTPVQLFVVFRWRIVRIKSSTAKQSFFLTKQLKWTSRVVPSMTSNVQRESDNYRKILQQNFKYGVNAIPVLAEAYYFPQKLTLSPRLTLIKLVLPNIITNSK
jgi:hypothetical protein